MPGWELLPHTADTGFRAAAATLEQLLEQACLALTAIALDPAAARPEESREIAVSGATREDLLVNLLNEVLWLLDGERWVPAAAAVRLEDGKALATLRGEPRDGRRHPPRIVVKAATYHQLRLARLPLGWEAEVYLDV